MKLQNTPFLIRILLFGVVALAAAGGLVHRFTLGNATWHLHRAFPGSKVDFEPTMSPDPSVDGLIRLLVPTYHGMDEELGLDLADSPIPLDLHAKFSQLPETGLWAVQFTRCKITRLCPLGFDGSHRFPSFFEFDDCDFSELPKEERALLQPYSNDPADAKKVTFGDI